MLSTNSLFVAAQVVALSTVFHLIPQFPFSVWSLAPNTADFPPDLQLWRSLGKYHLFLHKPSSSLVNIFYVDLPSTKQGGDTLLLLHGFPTSSVDFQGPFLGRLQPEFSRVIALDYPGYGLSDKPRGAGDQGLYTIHTYADVAEELLRALGAGAVHVLAHDVGDTVAQELLARANARQAGAGLTGGAAEGLVIKSVAFLNGGLLPGLHRPLLTQRLLSNAYIGPLLGPFMRLNRLEASLARVFGPAAPPSEGFLGTAYAALTFNGGHLILHKLIGYMAQRREHAQRWVGALQAAEAPPLLLINGPADPISGRHAAEGFREAVPRAEVVLLPDGVGHYPQVEAPTLVLEAYLKFFRSLPDASQCES